MVDQAIIALLVFIALAAIVGTGGFFLYKYYKKWEEDQNKVPEKSCSDMQCPIEQTCNPETHICELDVVPDSCVPGVTPCGPGLVCAPGNVHRCVLDNTGRSAGDTALIPVGSNYGRIIRILSKYKKWHAVGGGIAGTILQGSPQEGFTMSYKGLQDLETSTNWSIASVNNIDYIYFPFVSKASAMVYLLNREDGLHLIVNYLSAKSELLGQGELIPN